MTLLQSGCELFQIITLYNVPRKFEILIELLYAQGQVSSIAVLSVLCLYLAPLLQFWYNMSQNWNQVYIFIHLICEMVINSIKAFLSYHVHNGKVAQFIYLNYFNSKDSSSDRSNWLSPKPYVFLTRGKQKYTKYNNRKGINLRREIMQILIWLEIFSKKHKLTPDLMTDRD